MRRLHGSVLLVALGLLTGCSAAPGARIDGAVAPGAGNRAVVAPRAGATAPGTELDGPSVPGASTGGTTPPAAPNQTAAAPTAPTGGQTPDGTSRPIHRPPASSAPTPAKPNAPDMPALRTQLETYLHQQDGTYGIVVIDLSSGKSLGINGRQAFPAASTIKLPMALYILNQVALGKATLADKLTFTDADYEEGTGVLQGSTEGEQFTVRELVELAITESDNIATNILLRRFGLDNVFAYAKRLGGKVAEVQDATIVTTPRDMATYMRHVQDTKTVTDPELRKFLLAALEHTAFTDRVAAGVPQGVTVAHKIGTLPNVVNDVALVEAPGHPFIIAVFSSDVGEETAQGVIADLTRKVYDDLTKN